MISTPIIRHQILSHLRASGEVADLQHEVRQEHLPTAASLQGLGTGAAILLPSVGQDVTVVSAAAWPPVNQPRSYNSLATRAIGSLRDRSTMTEKPTCNERPKQFANGSIESDSPCSGDMWTTKQNIQLFLHSSTTTDRRCDHQLDLSFPTFLQHLETTFIKWSAY